jgi:hypothetical protein
VKHHLPSSSHARDLDAHWASTRRRHVKTNVFSPTH